MQKAPDQKQVGNPEQNEKAKPRDYRYVKEQRFPT